MLVTHFFHLAHFNYAVATDEQEFPPCEVAIVKYSLANGIVEEYHQFVNPGNRLSQYELFIIIKQKP